MKFLDQAKIHISSGNGGNGCVSFRREKYVEFGGPDGGDGGRGSDIIIKTNKNLNTLIDFRYHQHFKGKSGHNGKGKNKTGADAKDIYINVPPGTEILTGDKSTLLADMVESNQEFVIAKGGKGGLGNNHFKSSVNRAPRKFTSGEKGSEMSVWLSLKLFADVGIIGLPNAGKSSLLSCLSSAHPKIADYPFTTLNPILGTIRNKNTDIVMADIPGLIEGAHQGKGLGHRFLAHVERCKILLHLVDSTSKDIIKNYKIIRSELKDYGVQLSKKREIIAISKYDICNKELKEINKIIKKISNKKLFIISTKNKLGLKSLVSTIFKEIQKK